MLTTWKMRCAALVAGIVCVTSAVAEAQKTVIQVGPNTAVVRSNQRWGRPAVRQYGYGKRAYMSELGGLMVQQANAACVEMSDHYRHNRGYEQTYAAAYKLLQDSQHVAELIKRNEWRQSNRKEDHIARDLWEMDQLFEQVEDDISRWTARNGARRHDDTLRQILNDFEQTLDYLMTDYGIKSKINRKRRAIIVDQPTTAVVVPGRGPGPDVRVVTPPGRVIVPTPSVKIVVPPRRDR